MSFTSLGLLHRKNSLARISTKWKTDAKISWSVPQPSTAPLEGVHSLPCKTGFLFQSHTAKLQQDLLSFFKSESKSIIFEAKQTVSYVSHAANPLVTETSFSSLLITFQTEALNSFPHFKWAPLHTRIQCGSVIVRGFLSRSQISLLYADYFRKVKSVFKGSTAC